MTDKQMAAVIQGVIDPSIYDGPHRGLTIDEALDEVLGRDDATVSSVSAFEEAWVLTNNTVTSETNQRPQTETPAA